MRISDWSSDVCSSDLRCFVDRAALRDAGIVEQQIDAAELFDHLFARADQVRLAAHVTMDVERLSTERTQRAQRLCAARVIEIADADAAAVARVVFGQDRKSTRLNSSH